MSVCVCVCLVRFIHSLIALLGKRLQLQVDFIRLKSYEDDHSTGNIQVIGGDSLEKLRGKVRTGVCMIEVTSVILLQNVLIVEVKQ